MAGPYELLDEKIKGRKVTLAILSDNHVEVRFFKNYKSENGIKYSFKTFEEAMEEL